jgi:branched-chain amino acid transport system ATP-binding protein
VLLLDEVAAGLTEPEIATIKGLVDRLRDGRAVVWVEHIPFALRGTCARLVVMDKGAKLLDGPFDEVWAHPDLQRIYMGVADGQAA